MSNSPHHILLIYCPDWKGIIAQVTALLFKNNLNIVVKKEFVDTGHEIEKSVLAEALKLLLEDSVFVANNKTIIFN